MAKVKQTMGLQPIRQVQEKRFFSLFYINKVGLHNFTISWVSTPKI